MIVAHYPNPNKPVSSFLVTSSNAPSTTITSNQQVMENGLTRAHNGYYARKHQISVEEFVRRDCLIRDLAKQAEKLEAGKEYYPFSKEAYALRGMCKIKYILRNYADFDPGTWNDKDYFYIVGATDSHGKPLVTTANYFSSEEPTK